MTDTFQSYTSSLESPAEYHYPITPNDSQDLPVRPRALRVGGQGSLVVRDVDGTDVTYAVQAGEVLSLRAVRILATGTTASDIVGWY